MKLYEIVVPMLTLGFLGLLVMTQYARVVDSVTDRRTTSPIPMATPVYGSLCGPENANCKNLTFDAGFSAGDFAHP